MSILAISPSETSPFVMVQVIRQLSEGRTNATGAVTLTASATTTTVSAPTCGAGSVVLLSPLTANAAAVAASTYISSVTAGQFVVTHPSNANTDKSFGFVCLG